MKLTSPAGSSSVAGGPRWRAFLSWIGYAIGYLLLIAAYYALEPIGLGFLKGVYEWIVAIPAAAALTVRLLGVSLRVVARPSHEADGKEGKGGVFSSTLAGHGASPLSRGAMLAELSTVLISVVSPASFLYLFFRSCVFFVSTQAHLSSGETSYLARSLAAVLVVSLGALLYRLSTIRQGSRTASSFYSRLGAALALYGMGSLVLLLNGYAAMPFLISSAAAAAYAILAGILVFTAVRWPKASGQAYLDSEITYLKAVGAFFALGVLYALLSASTVSRYSDAAWLGIVAIMGVVASAFFYRSYSSMAGVAERISEKVYEQHTKDVKEFTSVEDEEYIRMIKDFLMKGEKEELLVFAAHRLTLCGMGLEEINMTLGRLIEYKPRPYGPVWPWEVPYVTRAAQDDAVTRKELLKQVVSAISDCDKRAASKGRYGLRPGPRASAGAHSTLVETVTLWRLLSLVERFT